MQVSREKVQMGKIEMEIERGGKEQSRKYKHCTRYMARYTLLTLASV